MQTYIICMDGGRMAAGAQDVFGGASTVFTKGTPLGFGFATVFGVPLPDLIQWMTLIWLAFLISGWIWDRFGERFIYPAVVAVATRTWPVVSGGARRGVTWAARRIRSRGR